MDQTARFPLELLSASNADKVAFFNKHRLLHRYMNRSYQKIFQRLHYPSGRNVIILVGCTGAGKTTLLDIVTEKLTSEFHEEMLIDKNIIPFVRIICSQMNNNTYDWIDHFTRLKTELGDPFPLTRITEEDLLNPKQGKRFSLLSKPDPLPLKFAIENQIKIRKCKVILQDEAQAMTKLSSGKKILDQMEAIKSFSIITNTINVLSGSYELIELLSINPQIARRTKLVYLQRYSAGGRDLFEFKKIISLFESYMALKERPVLINYYELLYESTFGCVGLLKDWLHDAFVLAIEENKGKITKSLLSACKLPDESLEQIRNSITDYEYRVEKLIAHQTNYEDELYKQEVEDIKKRMAGGPDSKPTEETKPQENSPDSNPQSSVNSKIHPPKKRRNKPGTPLPKNLPIGNAVENENQ